MQLARYTANDFLLFFELIVIVAVSVDKATVGFTSFTVGFKAIFLFFSGRLPAVGFGCIGKVVPRSRWSSSASTRSSAFC